MVADRQPIPFRLEDRPTFDDIGAKPVGHIVSPHGLEFVAANSKLNKADAHEMTSLGWLFHAYVTPPDGVLRIDAGKETTMPRSFFLPPGTPLRWQSSSCVTVMCLFGPDFITGMIDAGDLKLTSLSCLVTDEPDRLAYLAQQGYREACSPGFASALYAEAIGMQIALEVVRYDRAQNLEDMPLRGGLAPWQLRRLEAYVVEHLSQDLSLQSLSSMLGMSPRHLSRVMKYEKGVSVHRWIADLRFKEAQRLLVETRWPIHEIARHSAFKSAGAFSTAFRAICGLSPSEYRSICIK